jgi:hypothetical protein
MITKTLTQSDFIDSFISLRPDNFSYEGLDALYNYFMSISEGMGDEDYKLDVIAVCCDFTEYESVQEASERLGVEEIASLPDESLDLLEVQAIQNTMLLEYFQDRTQVIELSNGGVILQRY